MRATRRYWAGVGLAGTLALLAVAFARPVLLVGGAAVASFLVAAQFAFLRAVDRTRASLAVDQAVDAERVLVDAPVRVTLSASLDRPSPLDVRVASALPVAATGGSADVRSVAVERRGRSAVTTFPVSMPVAGTFQFGRPAVTVTDPAGLLEATLRTGPAPTVTVEPRGPRNVHVGEGGERVSAAFGEHGAGLLGPGFAPTELREYAPGDDAKRIDWNATARLNRPYVREDDPETHRVTALLVDHRAEMGAGRPGETKLDLVREVALGVTATAREYGDPLGCFAAGDDGISVARPPESTTGAYESIRRTLYDLAPTGSGTAASGSPRRHGPASARAHADRLDGGSPFEAALRPFFEAATAYVRRVDDEPLYRAARSGLSPVRGTLWTVLLTDDSNPAEVRETVKLARRGDDRVVVYLTPGVLFEPAGLADLEAAYERYREFESFRRGLARMDRVSAVEVAPGDRIEAVLSANRRRRAASEPWE